MPVGLCLVLPGLLSQRPSTNLVLTAALRLFGSRSVFFKFFSFNFLAASMVDPQNCYQNLTYCGLMEIPILLALNRL